MVATGAEGGGQEERPELENEEEDGSADAAELSFALGEALLLSRSTRKPVSQGVTSTP